MITKYVTHVWHQVPRAYVDIVVVEKESDCYVYLRGRKHKKHNGFRFYHDSFQEAKEYLKARAEEHLMAQETELRKATELFTQIQLLSLEEP